MSAPERKIGHDVLMFEGTPLTRREVLLARGAFQEGARRHGAGVEWAITFADRYYPIPTVTRPRVVAVGRHEFCLNHGMAHVRPAGNSIWTVYATRDELAALRSLDAEPTETVPEEEG